MASDEDVKLSSEETFEWNVENEIRLFEAMIGHKPVGINKHFHMACISEKFETLIGRPVSSDMIWKHLGTMFDLAALDKKESLPFPNEEEEFSLPESEYLDLINEKLASKTESTSETKESSKEGRLTPKVLKDSTTAKETKKDKKVDSEESGNNNDIDKKEISDFENDGKKGKFNKDEKAVKTRAKRYTKEKKSEDDTPTTPNAGSKKEEDSSSGTNNSNISSSGGSKKDKVVIGKRTLRSRADDLLMNKSLTPPPIKRARRI